MPVNTAILASSLPVTVLPKGGHHLALLMTLQWEAWLPLVLLAVVIAVECVAFGLGVDGRVIQSGLCVAMVAGAVVFGIGLHQGLAFSGTGVAYAGRYLVDSSLSSAGGLVVYLIGAALIAVIPTQEAAAVPRMLLVAICALAGATLLAAGSAVTLVAGIAVMCPVTLVIPLLPKGRAGSGAAAAELFRHGQLVFLLLILGAVLLVIGSPGTVLAHPGSVSATRAIYMLPAALGLCLEVAGFAVLLAGWVAAPKGHVRTSAMVSAVPSTMGLVAAGAAALLLLYPLVAARPQLAVILIAAGLLLLLGGVGVAVMQQRIAAAIPPLAVAQYGLILLAIGCSPIGIAAVDAAVALTFEGALAFLVLAVVEEAGDRAAGLSGPGGLLGLGMLVAGFSLAGLPVATGFLSRIALAQALVAAGWEWALVPLFGALLVIGFWFLARISQLHPRSVQGHPGDSLQWRSPISVVVMLGCLALIIPFFAAPSLSGVVSSMARAAVHQVGLSPLIRR